MFAKETYMQRRALLKKNLGSGVLLFLGNDECGLNYEDNTFRYRQDSTFLYYFGLSCAGLSAIIDIDEDKEIIFGDELSIDAIVWMGSQPTLHEKCERVGVKNLMPSADIVSYLHQCVQKGKAIHYLPPYRPEHKLKLMDWLGIPPAHQEGSVPFIRAVIAQRNYKSAEEIVEIEKACDVTADMHITAMKVLRPGMYEYEVVAEMNRVAESNNCELSFATIATINGQTLHNHYHGNKVKPGDHVIVETARGVEYGKVVLAPKDVVDDQVVHPLKEVLRVATKDDDEREKYNRERERDAFKICQKKIREHGLEMKLIDAEYTFDNNKVLFYFTADGRIDFRQLVKDLASIFKTRIELRQIGVRDETKILGGIGICGRCLCCHTYLSEFAPVSIKMAKEQNLSLNQTKISGVCGRLMCCLKNEQETYEELNRRLPGIGDTVTTPDGIQGNVQSVNVLRQLVKVVVEIGDEKEIQEFPVGELKFRSRKKKVKVSEQELKELKDLEDKKGDSKLDD